MDAELKSKWVEALRSGEYAQVKGMLRGRHGFCCLGVLADIQGLRWDNGCPHLGSNNVALEGHLMPAASGGLEQTVQRLLAAKNDGGAPFTDIAAYIEANIP